MPKNQAVQAALDYCQQEPDALLREQCQELLERAKTSDEASLELQERFLGQLAFGTAGMRGKMEAGFTRLNRVTVAKAAYAIGRSLDVGAGPVVVGHDARLNSTVFANEVASVLEGLGFSVLEFDSYVATPICAFAVKELSAQAGVMVTASHNPPNDNGLKVYGPTSAQITDAHAKRIEVCLKKAPAFAKIVRGDGTRRKIIAPALLLAYLEKINSTRVQPKASRAPLKVVYTPMHGVGFRFIDEALALIDFIDLHPLMVQKEPDGHFPTLAYPNPEEAGALDLAVAEAKKLGADMIVANDPDADRLAVAIPLARGDYQMLSGNDVGAILGCDVLENMNCDKTKLVVSTLVSSRLLAAIAKACGATYAESLTGFSRIAQIASERENLYSERFVFGFEEALGYCFGDVVRDKDGICAALRLLDRAALLKAQGKTLWDELDRIALQYGLYRSAQWSFRHDVRETMNTLRTLKAGAKFYDGQIIDHTHDLLSENYKGFAHTNILIFKLQNGTRVIARPSGTEPKIKFYAEQTAQIRSAEELDIERARLDDELDAIKKKVSAAFARPH